MGDPALSPRPPWEGRRVVLGVTGGIAAYKSVQLARDLTRLGVEVDVVMSRSAARFVGALSFQGVTGRDVLDSLWSVEGAARHLRLAREADLVLVAPATADLMARAAHGRADDLLTTLLLATRAPVLMAPAMNDRMWSHPQTQHNARHLSDTLGYRLAGPGQGPLAVGEGEGPGRMLEPQDLVELAGALLGRRPPWADRHVVITSGPTREPLDPVRYLGNRSSGRMGFALAHEAALRGARVTVVSGPTALEPPVGVHVIPVETATEMLARTREVVPEADVVIYAAAVADYRPSSPFDRKRKRDGGARNVGESGGAPTEGASGGMPTEGESAPAFTVELTENPDVALETRSLRRPGAVAVGFALETEELVERAAAKLEAKGFHLIVANPAGEEGAGFEVDTNRVTLLGRDGPPEELPVLSKADVARRVLDRIEPLVGREKG